MATTQTTIPKSITTARRRLFEAYSDRIESNPNLDRSMVSFQANKEAPFYRLFKYKEGFSSRLVEYVLANLGDKPGRLLDPFAGAGTALFASRDMGWDSVGIEILPVCLYAIKSRILIEKVNAKRLAREVLALNRVSLTRDFATTHAVNCVRITTGAFSAQTEKEIAGFLAHCERIADKAVADVFRFACFCVLEDVSYTRKDGQYLRWDRRCSRDRLKGDFNKGRISSFSDAIRLKLKAIVHDVGEMRENRGLFDADKRTAGSIEIEAGSCLRRLPEFQANSFDFVLTSPPYCNRYDYTRTYALELAFLGCGEEEFKSIRQKLLTSTVENREKVEALREMYAEIGQPQRFRAVERVFAGQEALHEVLDSLEWRRAHLELNNQNVPRMVRNYFFEMCCVICELARVVRPDGKVVMINDNVRYAGEEVPVDLILSEFAAAFGFDVLHIWTLPRGKGNSSQQMGSHGRQELRKCVYVWQKPR